MVNPDGAVIVSESEAGDKFEPCTVYVCSPDVVLIMTFPNDKDVGFIVRAAVVTKMPDPVNVAFCVAAPPPVLIILPV
jgi:hypothetical protein